MGPQLYIYEGGSGTTPPLHGYFQDVSIKSAKAEFHFPESAEPLVKIFISYLIEIYKWSKLIW